MENLDIVKKIIFSWNLTEGHSVAQLVGATSRKVAGSFPDGVIDIILPIALWSSNRNEYQEYFLWGKVGRCVRLTTLPHLCADCLEIWKPQPSGTIRACPGLYRIALKSGNHSLLEPSGPVQACTGIVLP